MAKAKRIRTRGVLAPDKYLTDKEARRLHRYWRNQARLARRNHGRRAVINEMILDVLLNTGLRATELCRLQMRDLPHCHGKLVVNVRQGKGYIQRSVHVSKKLAYRIRRFARDYRKNSKPVSRLFVNERGGPLGYQSLRSKVVNVSEAVGLSITPHKLRHTYAMEHYRRYRDIFALQSQLGHKDPKTTMIYARTTADEVSRQMQKFDL